MRSRIIAALMLVTTLTAARAAETAPPRKLQKVVIVVLAQDAVRATEVEIGVKEDLGKKGVFAESVRALMTEEKPTTVKALAKLIEAKGYESLLCMGPRKTLRLTPEDRASDFPTMENCLSSFLTGKYPSGVSLQSTPFEVDAEPTKTPQADSNFAAPSRTPIATNPGAAPVTYFKRIMRTFDVPTQALLWEGRFNVKVPSDLQSSLQTKWLSREATKALEKSGQLP